MALSTQEPDIGWVEELVSENPDMLNKNKNTPGITYTNKVIHLEVFQRTNSIATAPLDPTKTLRSGQRSYLILSLKFIILFTNPSPTVYNSTVTTIVVPILHHLINDILSIKKSSQLNFPTAESRPTVLYNLRYSVNINKINTFSKCILDFTRAVDQTKQ